jgi:hypothetical protein
VSNGSGSKKQLIENAATVARDSTERRPPRPVEAHPAAAPVKTSGIPSVRPETPAAAPLIIVVPAELNQQMQSLWEKSFAGSKSQQQGGVIVRDVSGKLSLVNTGSRRADIFCADRNVTSEQKILGLFHTRPYDQSEGGHVDVSLSGGDAEYLLNHPDDVLIAQSGEGQFMVLRTEATAKSVDAAKVQVQHNARIRQLLNQGARFDEASRIAARETAVDQGLAYYEGKDGEFKRVIAY